jgi:hypothetical protein
MGRSVLRSCSRWHHHQNQSHSLRRSGGLLHSRGGNEEGEYGSFGWGKRSDSVWARFSCILRICTEGKMKQSVLSFRKNDRWSRACGQDRSAAELGGVGGK